ncbi:MAG: DUF2384 domain-containing protein [bacterium]|nr:DUF2384 domain-containing protein [bacterium]
MRDLSPSRRLLLSPNGLAYLLRPSNRTCIVTFGLEVDRWRTGCQIPDRQTQVLLQRLRECLDAASRTKEGGMCYFFFNDRSRHFGRRRPMELLRTARGAERVLRILA